MKIRDSVSKETLKQFKSIAPGSNRKKENDADPITKRGGKKSWERDAKRTKDKAAVSGGNDDLMGTVVFLGCMAARALVRDRSAKYKKGR
ncbi:hypothetical protein BsIDN1_45860 [Bacillus safensis]|uniref:Uncharacterized protein n=1 Tax=Bacillus safensis TaxID=561879 RepID=A0A5S9MDA7_BACIA|nr:hypothetical protein BsIDN1_45860 [Bacillus safensis]